jgi:hypothetical protein
MKPTVPIAFFNWKYEGRDFAVAYQTVGAGLKVLLLSAMSTVSTRTEWFLRRMYGRHVFVDSNRLTSQFLAEKQKVARQRGARFAAAAFVTGALDPFTDRDKCIEALKAAPFPVIGIQTPPKSRAEMDKLAGVCACPALVMPGSLGLHEECFDAIIAPVCEFLTIKDANIKFQTSKQTA